MKRLIPTFAVLLGFASAAWAAAPASITTLRAVHALTNAEASHALPVEFEATITYRSYAPGHGHILMVQDDGFAVFVLSPADPGVVAGDRVRLRGKTVGSFHPFVLADRAILLGRGVLPNPVAAGFGELIRGQLDCMLVTAHGTIRSADSVAWGNQRYTSLRILMDGGTIDARVSGDVTRPLSELLDAEVEVTGVAAGVFDNKMQMTGSQLMVGTLAQVKVLHHASAGPESLPVTPMDQILGSLFVRDFTPRIRVQGTITYYQPGSAVVLQNQSTSLWIRTRTDKPMHVGNLADATGFPDVRGGFLALADGEIRESQASAPIAPAPVTWAGLSSGSNAFDLVSTEGQVLKAFRGAAQDEYVLVADGHMFSAIYRHPNSILPSAVVGSASKLPPMKQIPVGSIARVTGICMLYSSDPFDGPLAYDLLLRSEDDIAVVGRPSLLNVRNLIVLVGLLVLVVFAFGARGWTIEHKVRRHAAALAALEQKRGRILEDINSSRPLAEIIEQITAMVSLNLKGAPCWCQVSDGARLGSCPLELAELRCVQQEIPARSGPPLGTLFAGFDPAAKPSVEESEALHGSGTGHAGHRDAQALL